MKRGERIGEGRGEEKKEAHTNRPMVLGCQVLLLLPRPGGLQQRNGARRLGLVPKPFPYGSGVSSVGVVSRRVSEKIRVECRYLMLRTREDAFRRL